MALILCIPSGDALYFFKVYENILTVSKFENRHNFHTKYY